MLEYGATHTEVAMNHLADFEQQREQDIDSAYRQNVQDAKSGVGINEEPVATDHFETHLPLAAACKVQNPD